MFCALSLAISASCSLRMLLPCSQAKAAGLGPVVVLLASAASRISIKAGKADAQAVAERKRRMEVSCILRVTVDMSCLRRLGSVTVDCCR